MTISTDSTPQEISTALWNENDSYLRMGYHARTMFHVEHETALRDLNSVRLQKGMQFLRSTDKDIIADKLNLIADIHKIDDDQFSRSNLDPVLNQVFHVEPLHDDMVEFEAVQTLYTLFGI